MVMVSAVLSVGELIHISGNGTSMLALDFLGLGELHVNGNGTSILALGLGEPRTSGNGTSIPALDFLGLGELHTSGNGMSILTPAFLTMGQLRTSGNGTSIQLALGLGECHTSGNGMSTLAAHGTGVEVWCHSGHGARLTSGELIISYWSGGVVSQWSWCKTEGGEVACFCF